MGDVNQRTFIQRHASEFSGPYLEVGSKDYGSTQDLRSLFAGRGRYLGADQQPGANVDLVLDFTGDFAAINRVLGGLRFGTIFCLSVLEHCRQPFQMADTLTRLLAPGGNICISVPFAWEFHAFPDDYWRFTYEGVRVLFPRLVFDLDQGQASGSRPGEFGPLDEQLGKIHFGWKFYWRQGRILRGLSAKSLQWLARLGILRWLAGDRYVLAPTSILMIGTLGRPVR